jgi:hypothetical protein
MLQLSQCYRILWRSDDPLQDVESFRERVGQLLLMPHVRRDRTQLNQPDATRYLEIHIKINPPSSRE